MNTSTLTKQLQVEYIDPEKRPSLAERLKENALGTIVLEYDGRVQRVTSEAEQDLTNGLIKVVQGQQPKVYFVTGHGERDIAGSDGAGYGGIAEELKSDNFLTEPLVLAAAGHTSRCRGCGHCRAEVGPPRAGDRQAQGVSGEGRQAHGPRRPAAERRRAATRQPDRVSEGLVSGGRHKRRARSDESAPWRPGRRARRRAVSVSPDHRTLPPADGVSVTAVRSSRSKARRPDARPHRSS